MLILYTWVFTAGRWHLLPGGVADGRLAVVGDCDGLYLRVARRWVAVERTPAVGVYDVEVDLDDLDGGPGAERVPLAALGDGPQATVVAVAPLGGGRVRVDVWDGVSHRWTAGAPFDEDGIATVQIDADHRPAPDLFPHGANHRHDVAVPRAAGPVHLGEAPAAGPDLSGLALRYPGHLALTPTSRATCHAVT